MIGICAKPLRIALATMLLLTLGALFVSCDASIHTAPQVLTTQQNQVTPQPESGGEQATPQPIPTDIFPYETDWQEVMHLGRKQNNIVSTQGSFVASGPYRILAVCDGTGSVQIQYAPQGSANIQCQPTPELQGVNIQPSNTKGIVNVSVTSQEKNVWEVSVQISK